MILIALLMTWAVLATGVLGWIITAPRGPSPATIWDSDARVLGQLGLVFGLTRNSLLHWIVTGNRTFGLDALNLSVAASDVAATADKYGPGNFPSGTVLNLTASMLYCDYAGLFYQVAGSGAPGAGAPQVGSEIWIISGLYGNISDLLYNRLAWGGQDPLSQLGAQRVTAIRTQADLLHGQLASGAHYVVYSCPSTWPTG